MVRELDIFETREFNRLKVSADIKRLIQTEIYPYWKGKTVCDHLEAVRDHRIQQAVDCGLISNPHQWSGFAHVALSYYMVLNHGYDGLKQIIQEKRSRLDFTSPDYMTNKEFYDAALKTDFLKILAKQSGGIYYNATSAAEIPFNLKTRKAETSITKTEYLWDMPFIYILAILLLASEWLYRRRKGLS